jgi:RNA polymerase sigma factor (sigma-70 family)
MKTAEAGVLVRRLRAAAAGGECERAGDGELLARFVRRRDEAAFAALVRRHGAMVFGVARRQLREPADAEDVLQATFLLLARRAGAIRRPDSVGCWLYGVALRLARRSLVTTARRRLHETRAGRADRVASNRSDPPAELSLREARLALDEELARLPEKYRAPLVLCCLEGRTRDEAAGQLGWSVGLLKSRLEQARKLLHRRLVRRGLTLSGALAAGLFAEAPVAASAFLTRSAARAALRAGGASPGARALAEGCGGSLSAGARAGLVLTLAVAVAAGAGLLCRAAERPAEPPAATEPAPAATAAAARVRTDPRGDPLPEGALARFGTVRYRSGYAMHGSALSPDGKTLAVSAGDDITLWDLATGRPLHRLRDAKVPPDFSPNQTFLCFSPDGSRLASVGGWKWTDQLPFALDKVQPTLQLWDVAAGEEVRRFDPLGGAKVEHGLPVRAAWFTPDGKEIGVMLHAGIVRFLDADTGVELRRFATGKSLRWESPGVAPSPDGKLLAVVDSADEKSLRLFDVATGREVRRVTCPEKMGNLAFSPDSAWLAVADGASQIRLFDVATGAERKNFPAPVATEEHRLTGLTSLAFAPDGKVLYGGSEYGQILRWRLPGAESLPTLATEQVGGRGDPVSWVTGVYFVPGGRLLVSVEGSGLIRRWDLTSGKELPAGDGFYGAVRACAAPDGRTLAIGDTAGRLELFEAATGRSVHLLRRSGLGVTSLRWSPDGKHLAVGQANDSVALWDAGARREVRVLTLPPPALPYSVEVVGFGADGGQLLTSQRGLRLWDVATGKERWFRPELYAAALSPDGKTVAAGDTQSGLLLLDAGTGAVRVTQKIPASLWDPACPTAVAFSPDGSCLATARLGGPINFRDPQTGAERKRVEVSREARCSSLAFSPDGKWLLEGCSDRFLRVREVATGKELSRLAGHEAWVRAEFVSGFRTALSSSGDGTALLWDLRPGGGGPAAPAATLWPDLAAADGPEVYRAIWALASDPKSAVSLLREKLPPVTPPDEKRVRQVVARLDADAFADREKATSELTSLGAPAVPLLKKLQAETRSEEVRSRLKGIVEGLANREAVDFRLSRAVQVLELAATPEARQLLRDWSAGASGVALAEDARAALARLERADGRRRSADAP